MSMSIERARGQVSPTKSAASAFADASSQTALARENERSGQLVSNISDQMFKAQALQEHTEASNKATMSMNELMRKSSQDPDYKNSEKYLQEIDKIKTASSKGLTLKASKLAFADDFFGLSEKVKMDIKNDSHKKMVSKGIADLGIAIDNNYAQYLNEGNTTRQGQLVKRMEFLIDSHIDRGYLSPEAGMAEKRKFKTTIGIDKFAKDLNSAKDPVAIDGFIESLKAGDYEQNGITIDQEKKRTLTKDAESQKIKYGAEIRRQQRIQTDSMEAAFGQEILSGKRGLEDVYRAQLGKVISPGYANTLKEYLNSSKTVNAKNNPAAYAKILQEYGTITNDDYTEIAEKDFGKIATVRQSIMQAAADGVLTNSTSQKWLAAIQPNFEKGVDEAFLQSQAIKRTGFDFIGKWTRQHLLSKDERDTAKMYLAESLMTRIAQEEQEGSQVTPTRANEIARETLDDYIRSYYPDIIGSDTVTNSAGSKKSTVRQLHDNEVKATSEMSLKPAQGSDKGSEQSFESVEEAEAANLPSGTIVTIGGRKARIE